MEKVLVVGAARSGYAVSKLLVKEGYHVLITDQKAIPQKDELEALGIEVYENGHPDDLKRQEYAFIVKNPGIPYHAPFIAYFVDAQMKIYTEVEIAYRYAKHFSYGAITGTNGKTTTTSILYALLQYNGKALLGGNIGIPLSEDALRYGQEEKQVAMEISNFQLLGIETFHPLVSVVTNLTPDHLDYNKSLDVYYSSKMRVFMNQTGEDWFLRNVDDPIVMEYAQNIPCKVIDFSIEREDVDLYYKEGKVYLFNEELFDTSILNIVGMHNVQNAMVAAAMAYKMGVSKENIVDGLSKFMPVEHRLEYIGEKKGVKFYNDSKATNAEATVPALKSFESNIILLAGGYDKELPFDCLSAYDQRIKLCVAFGATKEKFKDVFTHVELCENMKEALAIAIEKSTPGDTILLSPACASYDQFQNFEQRGEIFKEYVHEYLR